MDPGEGGALVVETKVGRWFFMGLGEVEEVLDSLKRGLIVGEGE